jgi:hypothetical protein
MAKVTTAYEPTPEATESMSTASVPREDALVASRTKSLSEVVPDRRCWFGMKRTPAATATVRVLPGDYSSLPHRLTVALPPRFTLQAAKVQVQV